MTKNPSAARGSAAARSAAKAVPHRRAAAKTTAKSGNKTATKAAAASAGTASYHHGALRDALLAAAERIVDRDGVAGLTLRAAAREAGVSHAAPTHHFGDLAGLVSELAAIGFRRFAAALHAAADAEGDAAARRLDAMGRAYVAFATAYPGLFTLMFRSERLDPSRPALNEAMTTAAAALAGAVGARRPRGPAVSALAAAADTVRAWALVHGFATLLLDGRLDHIIAQLPPGADAASLLAAVLEPPSVGS